MTFSERFTEKLRANNHATLVTERDRILADTILEIAEEQVRARFHAQKYQNPVTGEDCV
jgi:hypothetical protein